MESILMGNSHVLYKYFDVIILWAFLCTWNCVNYQPKLFQIVLCFWSNIGYWGCVTKVLSCLLLVVTLMLQYSQRPLLPYSVICVCMGLWLFSRVLVVFQGMEPWRTPTSIDTSYQKRILRLSPSLICFRAGPIQFW